MGKHKKESRLSITWRRLRRNKMAMISLCVIRFADLRLCQGSYGTRSLGAVLQYPLLCDHGSE